MKKLFALSASALLATASCSLRAQELRPGVDLTRPQNYTLHRASSTDPLGGNADSRAAAPAATLTLLGVDGPGQSPTSGSQSRPRNIT